MSPNDPVNPVPDPPGAPRTRGVVLTKAAAFYDLLSPAMLFWQEQPINRRAVAFLCLKPSDLVLDVGCATGGLTLAVSEALSGEKGGLAIGIDASPQMIAIARKKVTRGGRKRPCRFDLGVAEDLPYENETFDAYASSFFFHHLNLEDKLKALKEAFRVLKPGGKCCIIDVDTPTNLIGKISAWSGAWLFKQPELIENIEGKLVPLFTEAGFTELKNCAHHLGYITTFLMCKQQKGIL